MLTDQRGINLIKQFETLKLEAYQDHIGVWTIGWGHTKGVKKGDKITLAQAEEFLRDDLKEAETAVAKSVTVPLTRAQHAALVSWTFNLGAGNLATSTMLKKLNSGNNFAVLEEMIKWKNAGGNPARGLARRRHMEAALFCEDKWNG